VKLVVVMPAFNAARHLAATLRRIVAVPVLARSPIVVIDDGSHDDTRARLTALQAAGLPIERVDRATNGGYGAAMKDGLAAARALGADHVACIHADGQYAPEALPQLLARMQGGALDLVQGSRIASGTALSGGMPRYKYAANAVLNVLENRTLQLALSDYHSGYLLYGPRALGRLPFARFSDSFDFDLEVIAAARALGLGVGEAPVPTHYGDEISHLRPVAYGLRVLRVLWNYRRGHYARA
jgi:glycosyltransferase involved in cell wall biosynthesis